MRTPVTRWPATADRMPITVRLEPDLYRFLVEEANEEYRSLNVLVNIILRERYGARAKR
jgi:hypothetical protein